MTQEKGRKRANPQEHMPDAEHVAAELAKAESMDDFFTASVDGLPGFKRSKQYPGEIYMNTTQYPKLEKVYQNYTLDSTRWLRYLPREDDIVISTSYKSGTTWMQNIVLHMIFQGQNVPEMRSVSPWLDSPVGDPIEKVIENLEAQEHRRCIKSHIALDGLPFHEQVKYIVVARDARDVFMSWWNHYSNLTDNAYAYLNDNPDRFGPPLPRCPDDINEHWRTWISHGWFEWESEGYPHSGNMHHTQTWWGYRHLENILFVHFNDLLANLEDELQQIAKFLDIHLSAEATAEIAHAVTFSTMKKEATKNPSAGTETWKQGMKTFFFKGTNGRWKDVLTKEDLAMYETTKSRVLTTECAQWLEQGRSAFS